MPNSLEGKIAVVTGVSHQGQIGETVAKGLANRGAALAICARTAEECRSPGCRTAASRRSRACRGRLSDRRVRGKAN